MSMNQDESTKLWDNNAEQWHRLFGENDLNRRDLLDPIILQILGDVKGKHIGCGMWRWLSKPKTGEVGCLNHSC